MSNEKFRFRRGQKWSARWLLTAVASAVSALLVAITVVLSVSVASATEPGSAVKAVDASTTTVPATTVPATPVPSTSASTTPAPTTTVPVSCVPSKDFGSTGALFDRFAGADRYLTAVAASVRAFPGTACAVYLVSGTGFADGLSAAPVAALSGASMLLTPTSKVPAEVIAEIKRLQPAKIFFVGGTSALPQALFDQVKAAYSTVIPERISGATRYATSRALVAQAFPVTADNVVVATGVNYPDALVSGGVAAKLNAPLLLVPGNVPVLDKETGDLLTKLKPKTIRVVGGEVSVVPALYTALTVKAGAIKRLSGSDRYSTGVVLNKEVFTGTADQAFIVSGASFADALSSGVAGYRAAGPVFLASKACLIKGVVDALTTLKVKYLTLFGGTSALGTEVASKTVCK